jgi:quinol monooxygenase YgiN
VKPAAVSKVNQAIQEFVCYVQANEPGTQIYLAWQEKNDPTKFVQLFIFADAEARAHHGQSEAVRRFKSVYTPEPEDQPVEALAPRSTLADVATRRRGGNNPFRDPVI